MFHSPSDPAGWTGETRCWHNPGSTRPPSLERTTVPDRPKPLSDGTLPREFYTRANVLTVARQLLGRLLVVRSRDGTRVSGIIVETEAYRGPEDRASHAYGGPRTNRTGPTYQSGRTAHASLRYGRDHQAHRG